MRAALPSFIGCLWTIDWLTQVGKQFFTSCRKALMSSYLCYPATSLCVLGKQKFHLPPMTKTWRLLPRCEELRTEEVEIALTWSFFWKAKAVPSSSSVFQKLHFNQSRSEADHFP